MCGGGFIAEEFSTGGEETWQTMFSGYRRGIEDCAVASQNPPILFL